MATITKRKDHWFVQVRLKDHKPIRKSFDTESKAIIWAANTETELKSGVYVDQFLADAVDATQERQAFDEQIE